MAALLNNVAAKGLLNRAHAYKAAVAANVAAGRDPDHGVNTGLYSYPVLMAADILALDADEVPVGADQAQHLEIAVDLAQQFSRSYRPGVLREPRATLPRATATLPGLDGRKMSKSYGTPSRRWRSRTTCAGRSADRHRLDASEKPKDPDSCTLFAPLRAFADPVGRGGRGARSHGGIGYGEAKARPADVVDAYVAPMRNRDHECDRPGPARGRLAKGKQHARRRADRTLARMMAAIGL